MKEFTIIWEHFWTTGSRDYSSVNKTFIRAKDIKTLMESSFGKEGRYLFEGFIPTMGEAIREEDIVTIETIN